MTAVVYESVGVRWLDTRQLEYLGSNGQPRAARRLHKNNFGPRLGVVGRLTRKDSPKARLVISVNLIGQAVSVEVDAADVKAY